MYASLLLLPLLLSVSNTRAVGMSSSSLEPICAASTCLFRNGSSCDRTLDACPRCVLYDPLLETSICTALQSTNDCRANYTLCPETPLDTVATDDHNSDSGDAYMWVELSSTSGSSGNQAVPKTGASLPTAPPRAALTVSPTPALANDAPPSSSDTTARKPSSSLLSPWLILALAVTVVVSAWFFVGALYVQSRDETVHADDFDTPPPVGLDAHDDDSKCQFSPNSYDAGYDFTLHTVHEPHATSSSRSSSPSSSDHDTNDGPLLSTFARDSEPHKPTHTHSIPATKPRAVQSLPPLQPRTRVPGWTTTPPSSSSRARSAQYSMPRFTSGTRLTIPTTRTTALDHSWPTHDDAFLDDTSSNASASCDDDVFLTTDSGASVFADCDYVDRNSHNEPDIYPDTALTTLSESRRMFSPLSMRTRDTAAPTGDVLDEWASHRASAPYDTRSLQQHQTLAKWKAKYYHEL